MPTTKCFALFRTLLSTVLIRQYVPKKNLNLDRDFLTTEFLQKQSFLVLINIDWNLPNNPADQN